MTRIKIIGPKTERASLVETLHSLKLFHLVDHKKTEELDIGTPETSAEEIAALLLKVRALYASLKNKTYAEAKEKIFSFEDVKQKVTKIAEAETALLEKKKQTEKIIGEKKELIVQLELLAALEINTDAAQPYKSLASFVGTVAQKENIEKEVRENAKEALVRIAHTKEGTVVAVFVPKKHEAVITRILESHGFKQQAWKEFPQRIASPKEAAQKEEVSVHLLEKDLGHRETELQKHEIQYGAYIIAVEKWLQKEAEKAEAPVRFAETKYSFMIEGWVSAKEYETLKAALEETAEKKVHIEVLGVKKTDKVPIIMDNLFFVKPFEFFMNLYTLPSYKEMDPSFLMFFSFPFFFGLMLGDVGYGIVTFLLFTILWWKMPRARNLLTAMMLSAIISIFFGFMFGEYFGFEHVSEQTGGWMVNNWHLPLHQQLLDNGELVYSFPRLMSRMESEMTIMGSTMPSILIIGAIIGFIHVNLGLFLGFINEVVSHGFKHAFFAKISWYILELGIACAALGGLGLIPLSWIIGFGIIILAAVMLFVGEGIQGLVEIPGIMTNILSYLRLGAVGLSSVGLAVVINENLALPFMEKGGAYVVVAVLILIVGHLINIALGVIGPFLHSMRLHYVEFFSKFYKGGGVRFVAFGEEKESE
ncbi:V-type ATP synthase subunit I, partial [Candidatus Woesearchaeota archaeon]|nr:V-type ATP synthase subunit I [Candidatus Woesearchaeota archaeon]